MFYRIMQAIGLAGGTYVHRHGLGNEYEKIRASETDQFVKFKLKGTLYILLKTIPPYIDKRGNKFFYMMESDVHTFDPSTGKVLDEKLEKEYKKKLLKDEIEKFDELMKGIKQEALKAKAQQLYEAISIGTVADDEESEEKKDKDIVFEIPVIKTGITIKAKIDDLTPHDTINEVMSKVLDGTILNVLLTPPKYDWKTIIGIMIVGVSLGWILVIMYAVFFPEQFGSLVGRAPSVAPVIIDDNFVGALKRLRS